MIALPLWAIWVVLGPAMIGASLWVSSHFAPAPCSRCNAHEALFPGATFCHDCATDEEVARG